jgi:hypothetical protein
MHGMNLKFEFVNCTVSLIYIDCNRRKGQQNSMSGASRISNFQGNELCNVKNYVHFLISISRLFSLGPAPLSLSGACDLMGQFEAARIIPKRIEG